MRENSKKNQNNSTKKPITRRSFMKRVSTLTASFLAGRFVLPASQVLASISTPKQIRIGTFGPSHCAVPFVYAKLSGFFRQEGLNVDLINYPNMPLIAKDLIKREIEFGQLIVPLAVAIHSGSGPFSVPTPLVIPQITGINGAALMVRNGVAIQSPLDFKGKTLGNHSKLSVHFIINMLFLREHGLDYRKDLNIRIVELDNVVDEVKNGHIDATVMPEPKNAIMEEEGIARLYMLSRYIWPNHPCCALVATRDCFEKRPDMVASVTRAMTKAGLRANDPDTREETIDLLRTSELYKYNKIPKEVLAKAFIPGRADFYPFPYQSSAALITEEMKNYGLLDNNIDTKQLSEEIFLSDFSRSIMKELGTEAPPSNYRVEKILGKSRNYSKPPLET
jgi:nitrate/nitrite transport system substrate-binding protein